MERSSFEVFKSNVCHLVKDEEGLAKGHPDDKDMADAVGFYKALDK